MNKDQIKKRIEEYIRCKNDFMYFISNYVYLELPGGNKKIKPYEKQRELLDLIDKDHFVIVLKSRQIGISTIIQSYVAWLTVFHDNVVVGIISKSGDAATKFSRFIMGFIDKLPPWLRPKFDKRNERSFILKNGSKVYNMPVDPKNPTNCFRSESITFLIIDETAFVPRISDAWEGIVSSLSTNQMHARNSGVPYGTILLSTPNKTVGMGKFFYLNYMDAVSGDGFFKPFIIHWKMIPELSGDIYWYKNQCAMHKNDPRKIQQELELKFLPTEGSFFDDETNKILQDNPIDPIELQKIFNGEIRVYERPIEGRFYISGVDTATENGEDKSAIVVFDYETMEQVWEYQAKCAITDFGKVIEVVCNTYPGTLVVENNSVASQLVEGLSRSNYHSMLYKGKLRGNGTSKTPKMISGLPVNIHTRPLIIDALYSNVSNYPHTIRSKALALELIGLVSKKNGKVESDVGCHDDLALAASFCYYVRKYDPPLMVNFNKNEQSSDFEEILSFNDDISSHNMTDNGNIMRKVKNDLDKNDIDKLGWINTLDFYI